MFQIVLSIVVGVFIGWNFHLFYISLEPKNLILSENHKVRTLNELYQKILIVQKRIIYQIYPKKFSI